MQDEVAVVTGGGRGIGRAIAESLAAQGAAVALLGRDETRLDEAATNIQRQGGRALAVRCDVTVGDNVRSALVTAEKELGPVSLLVNNAGLGDGGLLWEMDVEDWWRVQEVNLKGPLLATHAVLPGMLARGRGRIINVGSFAGNSASPGGSAYSTSKTALLRLTEGTAADVAGRGIYAFCISPGFVWTDMGHAYDAALRASDPDFKGMDDAWVYPAEAAGELCVRLASGAADALSGRFIHVRDDLEQMIARSAEIQAGEQYLLRLQLPAE